MDPHASPHPPATAAPRTRLSIRNKLLAMVLLPLVGVLPLLGAFLLWWGDEGIDRLLLTKVRSDLAVAQGYFERVLGEVGASTGTVAESHALNRALVEPGAMADLTPLLARLARRERLDFIHLHAPDGTLLATESGTAPAAAKAPPGRLAERTGVEVLPPAELALLPAALRQRVPVPLVPTRSAAPTASTVESRAMVLRATRAVRGADGQLLGHLSGGVLLNRNLALIDHINEIVYPEGSLPFSQWGSRGTVTLFLDDVRISTNVRLFGGETQDRAIGTRVSQTVRDAVLGRGHTWLDRAFVVDEWYVSGYQPLVDSAGRRIGMLYVGILEQPFTQLKYVALASISALFIAVMVVAAFVSLRWARAIFRPLEQMEATMQQVEGGAMDARVGAVASGDEIGRLARHLDRLLGVVDEHTRELRRWNAELDAKVAQRTLALEERTRALEEAQQQLVRSEKLATVGQLTASIAHEVNNPIAVIQGNLDLMRELLGPQGQACVASEFKLVDEQIERMRLVVTQLLQFARPTEYAGYVEALDPTRALDEGLVLVDHLLARTGIQVQRDGQATRSVAINRQELQQVLVNLLVNALHAMGQGGTLRLSTRDAGADGVEIAVADTGPGLAPETLARLFQPFFTAKKGGTGLGLWISRGIVERYGGDIVAANREGGGAVFTVRLKTGAA
ncbi:MAG: cache domain-containing protein [Rubrivivax sp.]|nr:cache domain-containing protein [Rubrivivax sp.]